MIYIHKEAGFNISQKELLELMRENINGKIQFCTQTGCIKNDQPFNEVKVHRYLLKDILFGNEDFFTIRKPVFNPQELCRLGFLLKNDPRIIEDKLLDKIDKLLDEQGVLFSHGIRC